MSAAKPGIGIAASWSFPDFAEPVIGPATSGNSAFTRVNARRPLAQSGLQPWQNLGAKARGETAFARVIAGLDPAIHAEKKLADALPHALLLPFSMDHRV
jgi:hypothetical protein